jgi:hypothetical protein
MDISYANPHCYMAEMTHRLSQVEDRSLTLAARRESHQTS